MSIDLTVPGIEALHDRRSEKWALHERDVLSMTIAEMDFPLAPPVVEAVGSALARDDLGYAPPAPRSLRRSFAGFAARRLDWAVDEEQVVLVPDVMIGLIELCRVIASPGEAIAFATPAYPPFYRALPQAGVRLIEIALHDDATLDLDSLDDALDAGARALVLASPHNPTGHVLARHELEAIAQRCAERDVWLLADEIHAPLTLDGAIAHPVAGGLRCRTAMRDRADRGVEGVQPRGTQGGAGRDRRRQCAGPGETDAAAARARWTVGGDRRRGGVRRRRPVARRGARAAGPQP